MSGEALNRATGRGRARKRAPQARSTDEMRLQADPAAMTPQTRLDEMGEILALGARRHQLSLRNAVDDRPPVEAECEPPVDGGRATQAEEEAA